MRLRGGRDGGRTDVRARVVWMSASRKTAGVRFVELSRPARRQIGRWLALLSPPGRANQAVSHAPSQMMKRAPSTEEQTLSDQNDDEILAGFSPSLGAVAGATLLLLSVLIFGLVRLSGGGNLSAEPNDTARILRAMPADTMDNALSTPGATGEKQRVLPHGAGSDDFPSRAAATRSRPGESPTPRILASSRPIPSVSDQSAHSAVRPGHEQDTAAALQSINKSPESAQPTPTETAQLPAPSSLANRSLFGDAAPIGDSLTAAGVAASPETDAVPNIRPGAAASPVISSAQSGPAAPIIAPPGHLDSARLVQSVQPVYPPAARKKHLEGVVELRLVVDPEGRVQSVNLVSGSPLLAQAALDAARQFRYSPALLDGRPIETIQTADISFQLKH